MFAEERKRLGGFIIFVILLICFLICYFTYSHVSNLINDPNSNQTDIDNAKYSATITYIITGILTLLFVSIIFYFFCIKKYRYIPVTDEYYYENPAQSPLLNDRRRG